MKGIIRIISATLISIFLITAISWLNGNDHYITYNIEEMVSPLESSHPNPNKEYFYKTVVIETITPSKIPLMFESKYDTISEREFMSRTK